MIGTMKVNLDQFELFQLLENSLKITRVQTFGRFIDEWWKEMNVEWRNFFFHYTVRDIWDKVPDVIRPEFEMFVARFNPGNQYIVETSETSYKCFEYKGKYWVSTNTTIHKIDGVVVEPNLEQLNEYYKRYSHLIYELKGRVEL